MALCLRKLELKDVPFMLEWMRDPEINCFFQFSPETMTEDKAKDYILKSQNDTENINLAVTNDSDEYLGTVSLKKIDLKSRHAEYAVVMRKSVIGTGAGSFGLQSMLKMAFVELKLNKVYALVLDDNPRSYNYFLRNGFKFEGELRQHLMHRGKLKNVRWYSMMRCEYEAD